MATSPNSVTHQRLLTSPVALERDNSDFDAPHTPSSGTSSSSAVDSALPPDVNRQVRSPRSHTANPSFVSSPLNPNPPAHAPPPFVRSRTQSRQSMIFNRVASEESQALTAHPSLNSNRTSMILYRLAAEDEQHTTSPPTLNRQSVLSNSGESVLTVSYDSKFPSGAYTPQKLIAYPFDPSVHTNIPEDDDALHDPSDNTLPNSSSRIALRGFVNVGVLVLVILALLCLFIFYPVWHYIVQGNNIVP